jgi:hypothetical protein
MAQATSYGWRQLKNYSGGSIRCALGSAALYGGSEDLLGSALGRPASGRMYVVQVIAFVTS